MTDLIHKQGFSRSPEPSPITPYQKAAQAWDERIGTARIQARNWRLMALILAGLLILVVVMLVVISGRSRIQPYIIKVAERGDVISVSPIQSGLLRPDDAMIQYFLTHIVVNMRTLPLDPVVAKQNWLNVYHYLSVEAQTKMNILAQTADPFADLGERTRSVNIENVVALSGTTKQFRWTESVFAANGAFISTAHYTGIFTYATEPPTSAARLQVNPLGLVITHFDITKDADP
jgi:type IV secretory pathway TrbF-like protein